MALTMGVSLIILGWVLGFLSTAIVTLRLWVRFIRLHRPRADDIFMSLAVLTNLAHTALLTAAKYYGLGRHMWTLSASNRTQALRYITIQEAIACLTPYWGRVSFSITMLLLLGPTAKAKRSILWTVIAVQTVINAITIIQIWAQCGTHPAALWNLKVLAVAHCQSPVVQRTIGFVQSALNSACDLVLTTIPASIVWKLHMPRRRKIGIGVLLCLSLFAFGASVAKAVEIKNLTINNDLTFNMAYLQLCTLVENNVVIIAASVPMLRPLWLKDTLNTHAYDAHDSWSGATGGNAVQRAASNAPTYYGSRLSKCDMQHTVEDGESGEYILGDVGEPDGGITKTTEVRVAYNGRSVSSASSGRVPSNNQGRGDVVPYFLDQNRG